MAKPTSQNHLDSDLLAAGEARLAAVMERWLHLLQGLDTTLAEARLGVQGEPS